MYIYVVGNIQSFFSVLTGIQMLFNPANNTLWASQSTGASGLPGSWALGLGLMFGFIIMILTGMNNLRIEFHKMMIIMIVFIALWEVQTSATVENMLTGNSVTVQGIPIGIVYPAAIFSTIAYDAAEEIGQADQTAGNNNPSLFTGSYNSNYGFAGPLALTYKLRGLYSVFNEYDSPLSGSVAQYVDHCIIPQASVVDSGELIDSPDLAATLFTGPNAIAPSNNQVPIDVNGSNQATAWQSVPCSTAQSTLNKAWSTFFSGTGNNSINNVVSMKTQSNGKTGVDASTAESVLQTMFTTTANGGQNFIGNLILNCAAEAGNAQAASDMSSSADVTDPSTLSPYCTTKAAALGRQQAMNAGSASLFESNMIPTMALLQFLFFAMAPLTLIIAAMMGAQGLPMLGKYMIFGAWTESWIPVAQIINDYIQMTTNQLYANIQTAAAATSITTPSGSTMTMSATSSANIPMILTHAMNALSMADMMMSATPIITLVLLTGSYFALTQLGSKISGNDVVDKNMSLSTPTDGTNVMQSGAYGVGINNSGTVGKVASTNAGYADLSVNGSTTASSAATAAVNSATTAVRSATSQAALVGEEAWSSGIFGSTGTNSSTTTSDGATLSHALGNTSDVLSKMGISASHKQSVGFVTALRSALGGPFGSKEITGSMVGQALAAIGKTVNVGEEAKLANEFNKTGALENLQKISHGVNLDQKSGVDSKDGNTASLDHRGSISDQAKRAYQTSAAAQAALQQAQQFQQQVQQAEGAGGMRNWSLPDLTSRMTDMHGANSYAAGEMAVAGVATVNDQPALLASYNKAFDRARKSMGVPAAASYALLSVVGDNPGMAGGSLFGLAAIEHAVGNTGMGQQYEALARENAAVMSQVKGNTDPSANDAAVRAVPGKLSKANATAGTPGAGATTAAAQPAKAGANSAIAATGGGNAAFDQGAGSQFYAEHEKALEQKLAESPWMKQIQHAVGSNPGTELNQWMEKHPEEAALAIVGAGVATGLVGGVVGKAIMKMAGSGGAAAVESGAGSAVKGMSAAEINDLTDGFKQMQDGGGPLNQAQTAALQKYEANIASDGSAEIRAEMGSDMNALNGVLGKVANGQELTSGEQAVYQKFITASANASQKILGGSGSAGGSLVAEGEAGLAQDGQILAEDGNTLLNNVVKPVAENPVVDDALGVVGE